MWLDLKAMLILFVLSIVFRWRIFAGTYANMGIQQHKSDSKHNSAVFCVQNSTEFISIAGDVRAIFYRNWYFNAVHDFHCASTDNVLDLVCEWLEPLSYMHDVWASIWHSIVGVGQFICNNCVWDSNVFQYNWNGIVLVASVCCGRFHGTHEQCDISTWISRWKDWGVFVHCGKSEITKITQTSPIAYNLQMCHRVDHMRCWFLQSTDIFVFCIAHRLLLDVPWFWCEIGFISNRFQYTVHQFDWLWHSSVRDVRCRGFAVLWFFNLVRNWLFWIEHQ